MFTLGWQVFRRHVTDVLDPARVRRAAVWSGVAAVVALVGMAVLEARVDWTGTTPVRSVVAMVLLALGVGLLTFACIPTWQPPDPSTTINGRQVRPSWQLAARGATQLYLQRPPVPVLPEHRDIVRTDTVLLRRGLIGMLARVAPLLGSGLVAVLGAFVLGAASGFHVLAIAAYTVGLSKYFVRLGRSERARLAAESLEPAPETPARPTS
ncbi:hypothetical protein [Curtobacterium poinsettiae]|uniref:RDD family protein n=1 Tax=Curtobacterium poinsettiae TaxID=159612 RepID=A0ABT3S640_9MICO|nr:hypothetical protein [Curtobacterium flaccumfaciens]MBT1611355.1 hypothetical protein [Curtobacterium flaccumfaciens pv. poinsettiae]MCX2849922.1 hypothetical protein [Curtobacterium flaccumfaciens pv. poinsettiae]UXN19527.1 hypothetical protein N8D78_05255 [Curtobacterium flaccumfaciens pv. poinsettiae]